MKETNTYITINRAVARFKTADKTIRRHIDKGNIESKKEVEDGREVTKVLVDDLKKQFPPRTAEKEQGSNDNQETISNEEDKKKIEELKEEIKKKDEENITHLKKIIEDYKTEKDHIAELLGREQQLLLLATKRLEETERELKDLKALQHTPEVQETIVEEGDNHPDNQGKKPSRKKGLFGRIFGSSF